MATIPRILPLTALLIASSVGQLSENRHGIPGHRPALPLWYQEKFFHARHDHEVRQGLRETISTTTARSLWNHREETADRMSPTASRLPQSGSRHLEQQHHHSRRLNNQGRSEKFSAVAVAEYGGTRAVAYAGYHNNHRHQQREAVTQSYQHVATTVPTYTKHHSGRRVCSRQSLCPSSHHKGEIKQIRLVFTELSPGFFCCPGWTQDTHLSFGCNKPTCAARCLNGGICTSPGKCTCPKGFTGNQCQTDVDECVTEKPCGQLCRNLPGSYECHCRSGFYLQPDGQSCRKNDTEDTAFEARDLENDFHEVTTTPRSPTTVAYDTENEVRDVDLDQDYEIIMKRLTKLEKQVARGRKRETETNEMSAKITLAVESINEMKRAIENMQLMQQEIYDMRSKIKQYEMESRNAQHLTSRVADLENRLRIRCRPAIPMNSGSSMY